jgi:uncharacterized protein YacL
MAREKMKKIEHYIDQKDICSDTQAKSEISIIFGYSLGLIFTLFINMFLALNPLELFKLVLIISSTFIIIIGFALFFNDTEKEDVIKHQINEVKK